jgi:aspartate kinase
LNNHSDTLVMKFGGASLATTQHFANISTLISQRRQCFSRIVVVVSAMGTTTDDLLKLAYQVNPSPPQRECDMLISVGERISMALLAMSLAHKGIKAISFTGSQSGIITSARHSEARIIDVRPGRILKSLDTYHIVIVAGFQGVSQNGEITTLGRGGSDTTAVALAIALNAQVEFYKDVPGFCSEDPKNNPQATLLSKISYKEAKAIVERGAKILHFRSLNLAELNYLPLHVLSFKSEHQQLGGTVIENPTYERSKVDPVYETAEEYSTLANF